MLFPVFPITVKKNYVVFLFFSFQYFQSQSHPRSRPVQRSPCRCLGCGRSWSGAGCIACSLTPRPPTGSPCNALSTSTWQRPQNRSSRTSGLRRTSIRFVSGCGPALLPAPPPSTSRELRRPADAACPTPPLLRRGGQHTTIVARGERPSRWTRSPPAAGWQQQGVVGWASRLSRREVVFESC